VNTRATSIIRDVQEFQLSEGKYTARFASRPEEIRAAQSLRYQVFNIELGEGVPEAHLTKLDRDKYDVHCKHLIITHRDTDEIVGTYRMQGYNDAVNNAGFYSAGEFDISQIPSEILMQSMEVGRACIHIDHRNSRVLFLLWKGLTAFLLYNRLRFLFGCCSLTSQKMPEGQKLMQQLYRDNYVRQDFCVDAKPGFEVTGSATEDEIAIPKLFKSYLNYGAKVCSRPAIDRQFGTIDYLVILDAEELSAFSRKLFFPKEYL
jgi:putative hemolysin